MACDSAACDFKAVMLARRAMGPFDIEIDMKYSGICHSDLHVAAGHMAGIGGPVRYPCVPGHELAGVAVRVGASVTKVKVGDHVGVGCMVDSCGTCKSCIAGEEQKCMKQVATYQGKNHHGRAAVWPPNSRTLGGYTKVHVVHENFAIVIPKTYKLEAAGPVMCAGITMYDPMMQLKVKAGDKIGIVGLGGLGVMGVKIAKALGCQVFVISRNKAKEELAKRVGASDIIASSDPASMSSAAGTLDVIINTVPSYHDYSVYLPLLSRKSRIGRMVMLGLHEGIASGMVLSKVTFGCSRIMSSGIGGIRATQEVINLCDQHNIYPELEVVSCSKVNMVYQQLNDSNDSGKRYVLDISTLTENLVCDDPAPGIADQKPMGIPSILGVFFRDLLLFRWW
jgi:D-arabinose 1-dehydrogenase-like Zn-dependent alcohol dehydrogenase